MPQQNDYVLIADYGRSGQGWLSYMLSYILNATYLEPYNLLRGLVCDGNPNIFGFVQGGLPGREKTKYSHIVKTHEMPDPFFSLTDKVILLARDPRDVAISAHNRFVFSKKMGSDVALEFRKVFEESNMLISDKSQEEIKRQGKKTLKQFLAGIKSWLVTNKTFCYLDTASRWKRFYLGWDQVKTFRVTYEEVNTDTKATLLKILNYLGVQADEKIVDEAVEKFSFQKTFGRKKGEESKMDIGSRKGIVGDHVTKFSRFDYKIFSIVCGDIGRAWGYKF